VAGPNSAPPRRFPASLQGAVTQVASRTPFAHSHKPVAAPAMPSGLGLDSAAIRARMVERLRAQRVGNPLVWEAMLRVPRHQFVDAALAAQAYEDTALPIGHGQTISKPSSVAQLLVAIGVGARPVRLRRVLDIGSGCGYQASVLALVCDQVFSLERIRALHLKAVANTAPLRLVNLRLVYADAHELPARYGQFDAIVSAASAGDVPPVWFERLAVGGVLVAPVGQREQHLVRIQRRGEKEFTREVLEGVNFVPLQSGKS
jgi:protein-L-isoaspartate(D-aspartate) O-methyltransferase